MMCTQKPGKIILILAIVAVIAAGGVAAFLLLQPKYNGEKITYRSSTVENGVETLLVAVREGDHYTFTRDVRSDVVRGSYTEENGYYVMENWGDMVDINARNTNGYSLPTSSDGGPARLGVGGYWYRESDVSFTLDNVYRCRLDPETMTYERWLNHDHESAEFSCEAVEGGYLVHTPEWHECTWLNEDGKKAAQMMYGYKTEYSIVTEEMLADPAWFDTAEYILMKQGDELHWMRWQSENAGWSTYAVLQKDASGVYVVEEDGQRYGLYMLNDRELIAGNVEEPYSEEVLYRPGKMLATEDYTFTAKGDKLVVESGMRDGGVYTIPRVEE